MSTRRDIPTLDGLRAISIVCVISAHAALFPWVTEHFTLHPRALAVARILAVTGVHVFFVISGYLITTLLLAEQQKYGDISLGRFYLRRTLRIFPPYYMLLGVIAFGLSRGWFVSPTIRWWPAVTYTSNFVSVDSWLTGHTWSLSVEEQFYLLWPALLRYGGPRCGAAVAALTLAASPPIMIAMRAIAHFTGASDIPWVAANWSFHFIAVGCLLALFASRLRADQRWQVLMSSRLIWLLPALVIAARAFWPGMGRWWLLVDLTVMQLFEAIAVAIVIAWSIQNATSKVGRFLDLRPMRALGVLSYSLYLWQQVFLRPDSRQSLATAIACALGAAVASYLVVERPALQLRGLLEIRLGAPQPRTLIAPAASQLHNEGNRTASS